NRKGIQLPTRRKTAGSRSDAVSDSGFFGVSADDHNAHTVYPAFDVLGVIGQGNTAHGSAALGSKVGTFYVQIFDQGNVVAGLQNGTVGIAGGLTVFFRTAGFGPLAGVIFHVHNIQQILRPTFTSRP